MGSTSNRGEGGAAKLPDNSIVTVVKDVKGSASGKASNRADILSEQGLPNFGIVQEDGAVNGNGEF